MGYEAAAPSFLFLLLAAAVADFEELKEKWDRFMDRIRAKMEK